MTSRGEVFQFFEAEAAFAHVEFFAFYGGLLFEPGEQGVVLLRGQTGERQGLFGLAVVAGGIELVGHDVADHAVLHLPGEALGKFLRMTAGRAAR